MHERTAQQLAGHADGRMTREIYTHVTDRMLAEAADAIERAIGDLNGSKRGSNDEDDAENEGGQER